MSSDSPHSGPGVPPLVGGPTNSLSVHSGHIGSPISPAHTSAVIAAPSPTHSPLLLGRADSHTLSHMTTGDGSSSPAVSPMNNLSSPPPVNSPLSPPGGPVHATSASSDALTREPIMSGWLLRKNAGILSNQSRKMYCRLTLGVSPTTSPSVLACFDSDAPNANKITTAPIDHTMQLKVDEANLTWTLKTKANLSSMQTGISWQFGCPTAVEYAAWRDAFAQVEAQAKRWDQEAKAAQAALAAQQKEQAAAKKALQLQQAAAKKLLANAASPSPTPIVSPPPVVAPTAQVHSLTLLEPASPSPEPLATEANLLSSGGDTFNADLVKPISAVSPTSPPRTLKYPQATLPFPSPNPTKAAPGGLAVAGDDSTTSPATTEGGEGLVRTPVDQDLVPETPSERGGDEIAEGEELERCATSPDFLPSSISRRATEEAAATRNGDAPSSSPNEEKSSSESHAEPAQEVSHPMPTLEYENSDLVAGEGDTPATDADTEEDKLRPRGTMDFSSAGGSTNDFSSLSHASFGFDVSATASTAGSGSAVAVTTPSSTAASVTPSATNLLSPSASLPPPSPLSASGSTGGGGQGALAASGPSGEKSSSLRQSSSADIALLSSATAQATTNAAAVLAQEQQRKKQVAAARAAEKKLVETQAMRAMKNRMYQKLFNLPATEQLIEDYSAAIKKTILLHGRLYISWNHICFFSSIFSHKTSLVLNVSDIIWASAASVALLFDNSIRIYVQAGPLPIPKVDARGNIVPLPGAPLIVGGGEKSAQTDAATAASTSEKDKGKTSGSASPAQQVSQGSKEKDKDASPAPVASGSTSGTKDASKLDLTVSVSTPSAPPAVAPFEHTVRSGSTSPLAGDGTTGAGEEGYPVTSIGAGGSTTPALQAGSSPSLGPLDNPADMPAPSELLNAVSAPPSSSSSSAGASALPPAHAQSQAVGNNMPDFGSGSVTYSDPIPTTTNASMDLTAQQLQYLIAIQHPNITVHFFASFLMRDHALSLIDGLLKKRREANPTWVAMQQAWTQADDERRAAQAAANAERKKNEAAAQAAAAAQQLNELTPPGSPDAARSNSAASSSNEPAGGFNLSSAPTSPASGGGDFSSLASPPPSEMKESASSSSIADPPKARLAKKAASAMNLASSATSSASASGASASSSSSSSIASPPQSTSSISLPTFQLVPRLDFGGEGLAPPPDDFVTPKIELDDVAEASFPGGMSARGFFDLFMSDLAIFSVKDFCAKASKGDTDWTLSSWFTVPLNQPVSASGTTLVNKHGPWVRDVKYKKLIVGSPLGPPVTRVHSQSVYTATDSSVKVESRNLTPDVPFGENLYVLERVLIEDSPQGCRVRVSVAVRFVKQPWKMKPFVSLIRSKTKEDVGAWYTNWLRCCKDYIRANPAVVQAALQRALGPDAPVIVLPPVAALEGEATPAVSSDASRSPALEGKEASEAALDEDTFSSPSALLASSGPPPPLAEWTWLRDGLAMVPVVSDHAPTILAGVNSVREAARGYTVAELLFGFCLFACTLSFVAEQPSFFGLVFNILLPWRWLSLLTSCRPELWLALGSLCLLVSQRSNASIHRELLARVQLAERAQSQQARKLHQQLDELKRTLAQSQKATSSSKVGTIRVDEHHFK